MGKEKTCAHCGKPFISVYCNQIYCKDKECQKSRNLIKWRKEVKRRKLRFLSTLENKRRCVECFEDIPAERGDKRTCCEECQLIYDNLKDKQGDVLYKFSRGMK